MTTETKAETKVEPTFIKMVEEFQCPGCILGSDTQCGSFTPDSHLLKCSKHCLGTMSPVTGSFALGLPVGFCRPGYDMKDKSFNKIHVRLWTKKKWDDGDKFTWDIYNVAVWAMVKDGHLFVRTYSPRLNSGCIDVVEGGTLGMVPNAIDVTEETGEMD